MSQPYKCPVCEGCGIVPRNFYHDNSDIVPSCRSCNGTGIVWSPCTEFLQGVQLPESVSQEEVSTTTNTPIKCCHTCDFSTPVLLPCNPPKKKYACSLDTAGTRYDAVHVCKNWRSRREA